MIRSSTTGAGAGGCVGDGDRRPDLDGGCLRLGRRTSVHQAERALGTDGRPDGRHPAEADRVVDPRLVGPHTAAAHPDDGQADRPGVLGRHEPDARWKDRQRDLGERQVGVGALEEVGGPAEGRHHAGEPLGGFARCERALARRPALGDAREEPAGDEQLGRERHRHLVLARLPSAGPASPTQVGDRLARPRPRCRPCVAQDLVHVGQQRGRRQPAPLATSTTLSRERPGVVHVAHEGARCRPSRPCTRPARPAASFLERIEEVMRGCSPPSPSRRGWRRGAGRPGRGRRSGRSSRSPPRARRGGRGRCRAPSCSPGSPPSCRACRRCGRGRARRSSGRPRRRPRRSARASARPCRRRRRWSACPARAPGGRRRTSPGPCRNRAWPA